MAAAQVYAAVTAGTPQLASSTPGGAGFTLAGSSTAALGAGARELGSTGASAGMGRAASLGGLSVPPSWGAAPDGLRLTASVLPGAGPTGFTPGAAPGAPGVVSGGIPPVAGVVNAPQGGGSPQHAGAATRAAAPAAATPAAAEAAGTQPAFLSGLQGVASEREELNRMREAVAELRKTREALKRSAAAMIREARRQ